VAVVWIAFSCVFRGGVSIRQDPSIQRKDRNAGRNLNIPVEKNGKDE
jgi:hypothetical protein